MTPITGFSARVLRLRDAFDETFASPPATLGEETEDILLVRIGGDPYALRSREMSGLATDKKIVPLPSRRPELIGVVGIRGSLLPVYSLAALLGYRTHPVSSRWLALSRGGEPVGFAFEEFEGFVGVLKKDVHAAEEGNARRHVREVARVGNLTRPVVDISSALEVFKARAGETGPMKEG